MLTTSWDKGCGGSLPGLPPLSSSCPLGTLLPLVQEVQLPVLWTELHRNRTHLGKSVCFPEIIRHSPELREKGKLSGALCPPFTGRRGTASQAACVCFPALQWLLWPAHSYPLCLLPRPHVLLSNHRDAQVPSGVTWAVSLLHPPQPAVPIPGTRG